MYSHQQTEKHDAMMQHLSGLYYDQANPGRQEVI